MIEKIKDWLDENVWPFTVYSQRDHWHKQWMETERLLDKKTIKNAQLISDIRRLTNQLSDLTVKVKVSALDGMKPLIVYYAVGDPQVVGNEIQYIYSEPKLVHFDASKWNLDLTTPEAREALNRDIYKYVSQQISRDIMRQVDPVVNGKKE